MAGRKTDRGEASTLSAADSPQPTRKFPHKVSFYQDPGDTARVRAALLHTQGSEGGRSLSAFIHAAVMKETRRLERKYNDGQPWSGVVARGIPQGRPLDS